MNDKCANGGCGGGGNGNHNHSNHSHHQHYPPNNNFSSACNTCNSNPCGCSVIRCNVCRLDPCACNGTFNICARCGLDPCRCRFCPTCNQLPCICYSNCSRCNQSPCGCNGFVMSQCNTCGYNPCKCQSMNSCGRCGVSSCRGECFEQPYSGCNYCHNSRCQGECRRTCNSCNNRNCRGECCNVPAPYNISCNVPAPCNVPYIQQQTCNLQSCGGYGNCNISNCNQCARPRCDMCYKSPCICVKPSSCAISCRVCNFKPCRCKCPRCFKIPCICRKCNLCQYYPCRCTSSKCKKPSCRRGCVCELTCNSCVSCESVNLTRNALAIFLRSKLPGSHVPANECNPAICGAGITVNLQPKDLVICNPRMKTCQAPCVKMQVTTPGSGCGVPVFFEYCKITNCRVTSFLIKAPQGHNIGEWELQFAPSSCSTEWNTVYGPVTSNELNNVSFPYMDIVEGMLMQLTRPVCNAITWRLKISSLADPSKGYIQITEFSLFQDAMYGAYQDAYPGAVQNINGRFNCNATQGCGGGCGNGSCGNGACGYFRRN